MKCGAATVLGLSCCVAASMSRAAELNLATLSCDKYETEILPAAAAAVDPAADSINTVMWLFGYAVAKSGAHVLYPDALAPFGFALDGECKSNPAENLLDALSIVKPETKNPMDLATLECATFTSRHVRTASADPESAHTIMMWLFGFSVAKAGGHLFNAEGLNGFQSSLFAECANHPGMSVFDALSAKKSAPRGARPAPKPSITSP